MVSHAIKEKRHRCGGVLWISCGVAGVGLYF
jgi:hypothetical protein